MRVEHRFALPASADAAFKVLGDIRRVVASLPGAEISRVAEDGACTVRLAVESGSATLRFVGPAEVVDRDAAARSLTIIATGRETRGRGIGKVRVTISVVQVDDTSSVHVETELRLRGSVADLGQREAIVRSSKNLVDQFARRLEAQLTEDLSAGPSGAADTGPQPAEQPTPNLVIPRAARPGSLFRSRTLGTRHLRAVRHNVGRLYSRIRGR